jgi:hypothetical protein
MKMENSKWKGQRNNDLTNKEPRRIIFPCGAPSRKRREKEDKEKVSRSENKPNLFRIKIATV